MKAEIVNGKVILDYCELFDNASGEELNLLVQSLACQDSIVKHVADQLLEGWTEDGYHGGVAGDANPATSSPIDQARRRIALGAGEVAKATIEAQQRALAHAGTYQKELWAKIRTLEEENRR